MKTVLLVAMLFLTAVRPSVQTGTAVIEGVVHRRDTGAPLAGVRVELTRAGSNTNALFVTTNTLGEFSLRDVASGSYWITAHRDGYLRPATAAGPSSVSVGPGESSRSIRLSLIPGGSISGRVVDSAGRPISGTTIRAMRMVYRIGQPLLHQATELGEQIFRTDAQGKYRVFWLTPGSYMVRAEDFSTFSPPALSRRGSLSVPIPTYFPGTPSAAAANMIEVHPTEEIQLADLVVGATVRSGVRLSGSVTNALPGKANLESLSVFLTSRDPKSVDPVQRVPATLSEGKFEIMGVEPGPYDLTMISTNGMVYSPAARASVEIGKQDRENVPLTFEGGFDVTLRATIVDRPANLNTVPFRFALRSSIDGYSSEGPLGLSGQTTFPFVQRGQYRLSIAGLPESAYVADVRQGSRRISGYITYEKLNTGVRLMFPSEPEPPVQRDVAVIVDAEATPIEVTLSFAGATISGIVADTQGPVAEAQVALVPRATGPLAGFHYKRVLTDASGRFTLEGIAPGEYSAFAWENVPTGAWENADFLAPYASRGRNVTLGAKGKLDLQLEIIK